MASYRLGTLPFLIPLFGGLFWETLKREQSLMLALLFCWVGDVLLLHDTNHLLQILSVSSYLMAQFLFIDVLLKRINVFSGSSFFMGILFFGAYLIIFFSHIYSYLEDMKFIGLAYGFTLSFLGCLSIMRFFQHQTWKRFSLFLGCCYFQEET
ncbi:MAG: lysoplasmalogenase family protein [Flavobacteriaceae bacterium]